MLLINVVINECLSVGLAIFQVLNLLSIFQEDKGLFLPSFPELRQTILGEPFNVLADEEKEKYSYPQQPISKDYFKKLDIASRAASINVHVKCHDKCSSHC